MHKRLLLLSLIVASVVVGASANRSTSIPDLVKQSFDAWNAHDADKVASFYTDDVQYEDVTFGMTAKSHAEMRKFAAGFMAMSPDMRLELTNVTVEGDHGSCEWVLSGTDVGLYKTGKRFRVRGASRFDLRGNKVARNKDFYDAATIMRQVGVLPPERAQ